MKMSKLADVLSKEVSCNSKVSLNGAGGYGGLGVKPQSLGTFSQLKKKLFYTIGSHFARIQSHLKVLDFFTFESQLKKLSCSVLL